MDPLGGGPLVALERGAAAVQRRRVHAAVGVEGVEHDRVALVRLHGQPALRSRTTRVPTTCGRRWGTPGQRARQISNDRIRS